MRKLSEEKDVKRVEGKITQVKQNADTGFIESVVLESGTRIEGDLFIGCTGFRRLLIEDTLNAGYEKWGEWLRNDSAVALQTEFSGDIPPYTRAIAHDSGWQWKIPLQHRQGTGHVYSSAYISDEDARNTLLQNLDGDIKAELRLLKFNTGRRKQSWVKNCVAVGLAGGFVEPLESTSIHLIQIGVLRLLQLFPFEGCNEPLIRRYNELARSEYEHVRDFIILHYKATERDDTPYWRDCRDMTIPDSLAEKIEFFKTTGHVHHDADDVFRVTSWLQVMLGQRIEPQGYHHIPHTLTDEKIFSGLNSMKANIAAAIEKLPSHANFLKTYCSMKKPAHHSSMLSGYTTVSSE